MPLCLCLWNAFPPHPFLALQSPTPSSRRSSSGVSGWTPSLTPAGPGSRFLLLLPDFLHSFVTASVTPTGTKIYSSTKLRCGACLLYSSKMELYLPFMLPCLQRWKTPILTAQDELSHFQSFLSPFGV